jgi:hypothetical protein
MGDEALALATNLSAGVPSAHGNRIFFDLTERLFVQMPLAVGVAGLLIMLLIFAAIARRRGALIGGTATLLGAMAAGGACAWLAITLIGLLRAGTYWRAHPEVTFVAIYATTLLGALAVLCTVARRRDTRSLRAASWLLFLLIGAILALAAPGAIIYFLIPPALVLLGMLAARWYPSAEPIAAAVAVLFLYLTWGELLAALEELFSPGPLWVVAPVAAIMIVPALVEAHGLFRRASARATLAGSGCIAVAAWIVSASVPAYSETHQQRFTIEHVTEFPSNRSFWSITNDGAALPPSYASLGRWKRGKLPFSERLRWFSPAPTASIRPPSVQLLENVVHGSERTMRLRLKANGAERIVLVAPESSHIRRAGVAGYIRSLGSDDPDGDSTIACTGRSCDGLELVMDLGSPKAVTFTVIGSRNGLPAAARPLVGARPRFARPQYVPDETMTIAHARL